MKVTLIHNVKAGNGRVPECATILRQVEDLGWSVTALDKTQLERALARPGELVIVAGGDGTVGKVAKRFAGTGIPIAVIPTGTANNVARTLGVGVDPAAAIQALPRAVTRKVDLGQVSLAANAAPELFIECFGVGAFAYILARRATKKHKKLRRAFGLLAREIALYEAHQAVVEVDGRDLSGAYLLIAVLNLRSLGPALRLAPDACVDDGELDLVLVRPDHRDSLIAHLRRAEVEGDIALPIFEVHRTKHVRLRRSGRWGHVDDCVRDVNGVVDAIVKPGAASFLVPKGTETVGGDSVAIR